MTETDLTSNLQATALAAMLESAHTPRELAVYRGALTPRQLDAPELEMGALAAGAAIHDLGWTRRVAVRGADRFRWLSGMVTNTVNDLFPNTGAWNLVLNAQGRIQGDLMVWRGSEELSPQRRHPEPAGAKNDSALSGTPFAGESGLELEIAADQYDRLMAHLDHFIIMDDVELVPVGEEQVGEAGSDTAVGLTGPLAAEVLSRLGLPVFAHPMTGARVEWNGLDLRVLRGYGVLAHHYEFWLPSAGLGKLWSCLRTAGAAPVGCASLDAFRIAEGIPVYGIDIAERDLPQETSQMRALHFSKGCYLGQEIVERIHSRGNVHRHLRPLELSGPAPAAGTELKTEAGKPAGQITSAAALPMASGVRVFALGMIPAEAEALDQAFVYAAGSASGTGRILAMPPVLS
ncbi:MAG TPA: folate-binding protein [Terracidiphilus sp.]|jgi:folate-binding protein YgfZ